MENETYSPEPSALTRKRIRLEEKAARRRDRVKVADWIANRIDSNPGQAVLVVAFVAVLLITARLVNILGN